jgi:ABC-type Fe3+/spermidine/putrescine transport system ATPase subunit
MATLSIDAVTKRFGTVTALDRVSLEVGDGRFVALLGPSGCGKTTLLRLIAGLESPSDGTIAIAGEDVTALPPEKRRIAMMFQSYALLPHMSVLENVRFPLRMVGAQARSVQRERAMAALDLVKLGHLAERLPRQLSGGQQQRVALARAIVAEPRVLLLDEPLSNLDARLREDMQVELIDLHRRLGLTTVFVTHDQEEALSLADLVVLMRDGRIEQAGAPGDLYDRPASAFAADFLGAANLIEVELARAADGAWQAVLPDGNRVPAPAPPDDRPGRYRLMLRQEDLSLAAAIPEGRVGVPVTIDTRIFLGARMRFLVRLGDRPIKLVTERSPADLPDTAPGRPAMLVWPPDAVRIVG